MGALVGVLIVAAAVFAAIMWSTRNGATIADAK